MSQTTFSENNPDGIGYWNGLYHRNKQLLKLSTAIFFASVFIGAFIGYFYPANITQFLTYLVRVDKQFVSQNGLTTLSIFTHNLQILLFTYVGGLIGVVAAFFLIENGLIYGLFLGYLGSNHVGGFTSPSGISGPVFFLLFTIPHGIFEISGFIIGGAAAFRLTSIVIKFLQRKNMDDYSWEFKDSIVLLGVGVVLLIIAATIEANITLPLGNYIIHNVLAK